MNKHWSKILLQLFAFNMWGFAIMGLILFLSALLGLAGHLPGGLSLSMMGDAVESKNDYYKFIASTAALSVLGWLYVFLRVSGRLRFVEH